MQFLYPKCLCFFGSFATISDNMGNSMFLKDKKTKKSRFPEFTFYDHFHPTLFLLKNFPLNLMFTFYFLMFQNKKKILCLFILMVGVNWIHFRASWKKKVVVSPFMLVIQVNIKNIKIIKQKLETRKFA